MRWKFVWKFLRTWKPRKTRLEITMRTGNTLKTVSNIFLLIFSKSLGDWKPKSELLWNWKVVHSVTVLFQHLWQAFCQQNFAHKPLKISNEFNIFQNVGMELFPKQEFADFSFSFEFLTVFFEFFRFVKTFIHNFNFWN